MAQWKLFGKTLAISAVAVLGTTAVLALAGYFSLARGVGIAVGLSLIHIWSQWEQAHAEQSRSVCRSARG